MKRFFQNLRFPSLRSRPTVIPEATDQPAIHFIWAGGSKLLPEKNLAAITEWALANPNSQIYLWIDETSFRHTESLQGTSDIRSYYIELFKELSVKGIVVHIHDIQELHKENLYPAVRYEIDKLRPNYGSSSDALRYLILSKKPKSAYFDSDVYHEPGETDSFTKWMLSQVAKDKNTLYVYDRSQGGDVIGNDVFYVTQAQNPALQKIITKVADNYTSALMQEVITPYVFAYHYNVDVIKASDDWKITLTLMMTGPKCVRSIIASDDPTQIDVKIRADVALFPEQFINAETQNDHNWVAGSDAWLRKVNGNLSVEEILQKCENSMKFEIQRWGVLCLDDYYRDGLILADAHAQEFSQGFTDLVSELYSRYESQVLCVKLSYLYEPTIELCKTLQCGLYKSGEFNSAYHECVMGFLYDQDKPQATARYLVDFAQQLEKNSVHELLYTELQEQTAAHRELRAS